MRFLFLITFALCCLCIQAKDLKINRKAHIKSISINIEKVEKTDYGTIVHVKVKQQENFSYGISFSDVYISKSNQTNPTRGTLNSWNGNSKIEYDTKNVSDQNFDKFTLTFPGFFISEGDVFDIKLGNLLDRNKTDLILKDIQIKK